MDPPLILDVRTGVVSIIQEFAGAYTLFQAWRKGRAGKKAVGQEECETSLYEGRDAIEATFKHFSVQHGARFDAGDKTSVDGIINIQKTFHNVVVDVLVEKRGSKAKLEPVALREASEAARKKTILAMDELSNRIRAEAAGPFRATDPGDVLPPMPLRPVRPPQSPRATSAGTAPLNQASLHPQTNQTGLDSLIQGTGSANSSQTSLKVPLAPVPQRNTIYSPAAGWTMPKFESPEDLSNALVRTSSTRSARSAIDRWFSASPRTEPVRPYHEIQPLEPTPPVVPSFKYDGDPWDILREGEAAVQRSWAAASNTIDVKRSQSARSAPLLQGPWASIWEDEPEPRPTTPLLYEREATPPTPEEESPQRAQNRSAAALPGKRIRSEPMLQFSTPAPRIRRHVSGPAVAPNT